MIGDGVAFVNEGVHHPDRLLPHRLQCFSQAVRGRPLEGKVTA
jgi:hypothetical protein